MKNALSRVLALVMLTALLTGCGGDGANIHVIVRDGNGAPVAGVKVQACDDSLCKTADTDETGAADFTMGKNETDIHLLKVPESFAMEEKTFRTDSSGNLTVTLKPAGKAAAEKEERAEEAPTAPFSADLAAYKLEDYLPAAEHFVTAPRFSTTDINGETVTEEIFAGNKITVVNYFASWCGPCRKELPMFIRLYERFSPDGVGFVGIWDPHSDTEKDMKRTIEEFAIPYPVIAYTSELEAAIPGLPAFPTTFLVDSRGSSLDITEKEIEKYIIDMYASMLEMIRSGKYDSLYSSEEEKDHDAALIERILEEKDYQADLERLYEQYPGGFVSAMPEDFLLMLIADRLLP